METIFSGRLPGYQINSNRIAADDRPFHEATASEFVENVVFSMPTPKQIGILLGALASVIMLLSATVEVANKLTGGNTLILPKLVKAFSADLELNVPNFFSMLLLLFVSSLLALTALIKRKLSQPYAWHWLGLALGFGIMAFDEIVSAHEKLIEPMQAVMGKQNLGLFYFAWVVPAIGLLLVLAAIFFRFWWKLPSKTRILFFIAGSVYLGGAVGMELIGGRYFEAYGSNLTYVALTTFEESLESAGLVVFACAVIAYLRNQFSRLEVRTSSSDT